MQFKMSEMGPQLTAGRIAKAERKLKVVLPDDYK